MSNIEIIKSLIEDIEEAKKHDKETLMINLITSRLDKSLDSYINALTKDTTYLQFRNSLKLMRKLNK